MIVRRAHTLRKQRATQGEIVWTKIPEYMTQEKITSSHLQDVTGCESSQENCAQCVLQLVKAAVRAARVH